MSGKGWIYLVIAVIVSLFLGAFGYWLFSAQAGPTGPLGDTVTVRFDRTGAAPELKVDKKFAFADRTADLQWLREESQDFAFEVFFPNDSPFEAALGKKLKSKDQDGAKKWHGIKEKIGKDAPEGCYHYIVAAYIDGEIYILDPEIIVPRPGKG